MNIYNYEDISQYLNDHFKAKKENNPAFSLQVWCKKIGMTSSSALSHIISGHRPIPAKFVPRLIDNLNLSEHESRYFMELYFKDKDSQNEGQKTLVQRLNPLNWKTKKFVKDPSFLKNPLSFALVVLKQRGIIKDATFENLREALTPDITDQEIQHFIDSFKSNEKFDADRIVTIPDIRNIEVQRTHLFYLELAKKRVYSTDVNLREYNSYSINIKKEQIPEMKEEIRHFLDSLIEKYDNDKDCDSTYQIGNYLYPLTREKN